MENCVPASSPSLIRVGVFFYIILFNLKRRRKYDPTASQKYESLQEVKHGPTIKILNAERWRYFHYATIAIVLLFSASSTHVNAQSTQKQSVIDIPHRSSIENDARAPDQNIDKRRCFHRRASADTARLVNIMYLLVLVAWASPNTKDLKLAPDGLGSITFWIYYTRREQPGAKHIFATNWDERLTQSPTFLLISVIVAYYACAPDNLLLRRIDESTQADEQVRERAVQWGFIEM